MPRVDGHMIMHKKSGTISKVQEEGGLYVYPLWMKQKSEDEGLRIGAVDKTPDEQTRFEQTEWDIWDPF